MKALALALSFSLVIFSATAAIDADKAAELSRAIREQYRLTGFNWISPKMLKEEVELGRNTKPLLYVLTSRSCADCRRFLDSFRSFGQVMLSSLSAQFLAVLVLDDYALELGPEFEPPHGDYLPRAFFADPDGKLRMDLINTKAENNAPYYYGNAGELVEAMQRVLQAQREDLGTDMFLGDLAMDM